MLGKQRKDALAFFSGSLAGKKSIGRQDRMSSSCSPSDRAPEILESVSLLQYLTKNIENESLPIETRYNLLLELILTLENAADNMKYFQGEQVFESLTLYTEASK